MVGGDSGEEMTPSVFSEHWGKLSSMLSMEASEAVEAHLSRQPTVPTPAPSVAATPRATTGAEGTEEEEEKEASTVNAGEKIKECLSHIITFLEKDEEQSATQVIDSVFSSIQQQQQQ